MTSQQWKVSGVNRISVILLHSIYSCILPPCGSHSQSVAVRHTCGFISCQDSFTSSYNPLSDVAELLLLLSTQEGIRMSHDDWVGDLKGEKGQRLFLTDFFMGETQKY